MSTIEKTAIEPPETRIVMHDVAWSTYVELADQRRGSVPRMTYDERESAKRLSSKTFGSESSSRKM